MNDFTGSLILVADDSNSDRLATCQFLAEKGYNFCEAANAKEAIKVFDLTSPKMVLLDTHMPIIDGVDSLDACRRIREIDRDEYSPIIMLTEDEENQFIHDAFQAGAADYIRKPISWSLLEHRIKYKLKTSRMAYELEASEKRFRQLFDDSPLPYQALDDNGRIVDANNAWLEMMNVSADQSIGKSFADFMTEAEWRKFMYAFPSFIKTGSISNLHLTVITGADENIDIELNGRVAYDYNGDFKQTHGILQNITERKAMDDELRRLATTDSLTGLANRRYFSAVANRALKQCMRYKHPYSLMMLDIDHFKAVNDTYGHDIGDDVLKSAASVMNALLRNVDILGRLGGEEFAIALPETNILDAVNLAERIRAAIERFSVETEQGRVCFTISIGVATLNNAEKSNEQLLKHADNLLYQAKQSGRNRVEYC